MLTLALTLVVLCAVTGAAIAGSSDQAFELLHQLPDLLLGLGASGLDGVFAIFEDFHAFAEHSAQAVAPPHAVGAGGELVLEDLIVKGNPANMEGFGRGPEDVAHSVWSWFGCSRVDVDRVVGLVGQRAVKAAGVEAVGAQASRQVTGDRFHAVVVREDIAHGAGEGEGGLEQLPQ